MTRKFELLNHSTSTCFEPIWPFHNNDKVHIIDKAYTRYSLIHTIKDNIIGKWISDEKTRLALIVKIMIIIDSK